MRSRILSGERSGQEVLPRIQAAVQTNRLAERYLSVRPAREKTMNTRAVPSLKLVEDTPPNWDVDGDGDEDDEEDGEGEDEYEDELAELRAQHDRRVEALKAFGEQLEAARAAKASPRAQLLERYQQARKRGLNDSAALSEALATHAPRVSVRPSPTQPVNTPPHLRLDRKASYEAEARKQLSAQGVYTEDEVRIRAAALAVVAKRIPLLPTRSEAVTFQGQPQVINSHGQLRLGSASLGYSTPATGPVTSTLPILGR
jgi:hypothetical protein